MALGALEILIKYNDEIKIITYSFIPIDTDIIDSLHDITKSIDEFIKSIKSIKSKDIQCKLESEYYTDNSLRCLYSYEIGEISNERCTFSQVWPKDYTSTISIIEDYLHRKCIDYDEKKLLQIFISIDKACLSL